MICFYIYFASLSNWARKSGRNDVRLNLQGFSVPKIYFPALSVLYLNFKLLNVEALV